MSNASMSARDARHVFGPDSEPTEMEMRVAEAIKSAHYSKPAGGLGASYLSLARIAIRAMREATTEMLREAGMVVAGNTEAHATVWETMIDAASPGDE